MIKIIMIDDYDYDIDDDDDCGGGDASSTGSMAHTAALPRSC